MHEYSLASALLDRVEQEARARGARSVARVRGYNTYVHQLPSRRKAGKVSLKNGIGKSALIDWYFEVMMETYKRKPVTITLMDSSHKSLMTWNMEGALPIKWTGPQIQTDTSAIAIQTLDFVCGEITVKFV